MDVVLYYTQSVKTKESGAPLNCFGPLLFFPDKFEWLGPNPFTSPQNHPCYGIFADSRDHWGSVDTWFRAGGLLMGIPYFCSAFLCHFNVFSVFAEMRNPSKKRLKKVRGSVITVNR